MLRAPQVKRKSRLAATVKRFEAIGYVSSNAAHSLTSMCSERAPRSRAQWEHTWNSWFVETPAGFPFQAFNFFKPLKVLIVIIKNANFPWHGPIVYDPATPTNYYLTTFSLEAPQTDAS